MTHNTQTTKPNLPNPTYQTQPTKPNLPNPTYQTQLIKQNQANKTYKAKYKPKLNTKTKTKTIGFDTIEINLVLSRIDSKGEVVFTVLWHFCLGIHFDQVPLCPGNQIVWVHFVSLTPFWQVRLRLALLS